MRGAPQWILWRNVEGRKLPFRLDGRLAKSNDPETWTDFESAADAAKDIPEGEGGLGFVFSAEDEFFGVDLDGCIGPSGTVEPWAGEAILKLGSYAEVSPSGTGVKVFGLGKLSDGKGRKAPVDGVSQVSDKVAAVEIYDRGRYFTVTGQALAWADRIAPSQAGLDWVLAKFFPQAAPSRPSTIAPSFSPGRPELTERARAYMLTVDPAVSGAGGHNTTFRAACALVLGFGLDPETAFPLLAEWNERCDPPWTEKELEHKLRSADKQGGERGYLVGETLDSDNNRAVMAELGERSRRAQADEAEELAAPVPKCPPFPDEVLAPPGWLSEVIEWNLSTALYPMRKLALAGALALLSTITGRKLTDGFGTRTNIYSLGLAPSGSGKEHARTVNKRILQAAGAGMRLGPERIGSSAGLVNWVKSEPAILFQLDEIGRLFATMKSAAKSPHLFNIASVLMSLYSSAGERWVGEAYADVERTPRIDQPHAVVYGTTTPADFWESLTASNVSDGFLGRFYAFEDDDGPYNKNRDSFEEVPKRIVDGAKFWLDLETGSGNLTNVSPKPLSIVHSDEALERFDNHLQAIRSRRAKDEETTGALWSRSGGKAGKLALLFAASRCTGKKISVELQDVDLAIKLANWLTRRMIYQVSEQVSENETAARKKRILRLIGDSTITANQLSRKTQFLNRREREELVGDLVTSGLLEVCSSPTGGRTATCYRRPGVNSGALTNV